MGIKLRVVVIRVTDQMVEVQEGIFSSMITEITSTIQKVDPINNNTKFTTKVTCSHSLIIISKPWTISITTIQRVSLP